MSRRGRRTRAQEIGLVAGASLALGMLLLPAPEGLSAAAWRVAAFAACMGVWWATEAIPVPATALLPIAAFPIAGVADVKTVTAPYANPTIYLFLGGFMVALALQRWRLHRRLALGVVSAFGGSGAAIVGGFMVASALVSMWVTNTATTLMLLPIATSVVALVQENLEDSEDLRERFPVAMMLGIAYGATIGGLGTLIGTPPNALLAAFMSETYGVEIGFGEWLLVGVPLTLVLLPICWWLLTHRIYPVRFSTRGEVRRHLVELRNGLGPMSSAERRMAMVFAALAIGWVLQPVVSGLPGLGGLSDAGWAILVAILLFLIPSGTEKGARLLSWPDLSGLPWGLLVLFGGGLSLASAVSSTGLAHWLGQGLVGLGLTSLVALVVVVTVLIIFLTELTSNTATAATFLPVVGAVALEAGHAPIALAAPAALAASCAFMLPVATPPNAVVYGSGMLTIPQMVRAGFWLNLISVVVVSLAAVLLVPWALS